MTAWGARYLVKHHQAHDEHIHCPAYGLKDPLTNGLVSLLGINLFPASTLEGEIKLIG